MEFFFQLSLDMCYNIGLFECLKQEFVGIAMTVSKLLFTHKRKLVILAEVVVAAGSEIHLEWIPCWL